MWGVEKYIGVWGRCRKVCWGVKEMWESVLMYVKSRGRCEGVGKCWERCEKLC